MSLAVREINYGSEHHKSPKRSTVQEKNIETSHILCISFILYVNAPITQRKYCDVETLSRILPKETLSSYTDNHFKKERLIGNMSVQQLFRVLNIFRQD